MGRKIFISYRREDSAANALGIGQYLEHEFGHKNVFIDVDMRAGTKFPAFLEQRLAECKVMLVLIGPAWLSSSDAQGHRRLDSSDDWVRLEIAHALKRDITVIPVRVNGAELPARTALPEDIRGLLDHQAVSVTNTGFRHEMSGLVKDIRAIEDPKRRRRIGIAAALLLLLIALALVPISVFSNSVARLRALVLPQGSNTTTFNDIWSSTPGEWVMYAADKSVAYYFKPTSLDVFGDHVAFTIRYPLKSFAMKPAAEQLATQSAYEDDTLVLDCKRSVSLLAEKTVYNKSGEIISHYKRGDPQSLDLSAAEQIPTGSVLSIGARLLCNEQQRASLSRELTTTKLSYLSPGFGGDAEIFNSPPKKDLADSYEVLFVVKYYQDRQFAEFFPGQDIVGLPRSYRIVAQSMQVNCLEKKLQSLQFGYFDRNNILEHAAPASDQLIEFKEGSPFGMLFNVVCGAPAASVNGKYEGTNYATYKVGGKGDEKISIVVEQTGSKLQVSFQTASGGQGKGEGQLKENEVKSISLQSTAPGCPGSYDGSLKFNGNNLSWLFKGQDCGGPMEGHGTAARTKQ